MSANLVSPAGTPIVATNWPEIYLDPSIASGYHISQLLYAAVLGAQGWELLTTLESDFKLLFRRKIYVSTVAYLLSRYAAFTYTIVSFIFQSVRVPHGTCQSVQYGLAVCYIVASPATSMLFYLRSMAVYNWQRIAAVLLGLCWLSTLAGALVIPWAVTGAEVADTQRCINTGAAPFSSAVVATSFANDTAVWLAITARIVFNNYSSGRLSDIVRLPGRLGSSPPATASPVTQQLLKQGMLYYGITVVGNIITLAVLLSSSINPVIRSMLTIPNLALTSSMACRVHRQLIFGTGRAATSGVHQLSDPERSPGGIGGGDNGQFRPRKPHAGYKAFDAPAAPLVALETVRVRDGGSERLSSSTKGHSPDVFGTPSTLVGGSIPNGGGREVHPFTFEDDPGSEENQRPVPFITTATTGLFPQRLVARVAEGQRH